ncbi:glycoside hydrolase family 18 protein [Mycena belliarum]|uniref:chitinase n=1 Tax=Mycena belliarum TaxID=1033014 RepID=A0AAD6U653_9AGAR|nr:glycoside hydrolase family 18 protein [Mycena belliae]
MVSFTLGCLASIASAFLFFSRANSIPTNVTAFEGLGQQARDLLARATPAAPHWVVYGDQYVPGTTGPPATSAVNGYNVFILSFLLTEGAWDKAYEWTTYTAAQRATIKAQYVAAGIRLLVSAFGSTDVPTSSGADPIATAKTMANWVIQYDLDGIDVDYEDFNAFDAGNGKAEAWLISFTTQLRALLPQGTYIITHAPVAPWFSPTQWGGGGYLKVHASVGNLIDWYNVQFYNQGATEYTTCANLLTTSSNTWPKTALFQIAASGVPLSKLVIGKPGTSSAASNGYMSASTLAGCLATAKGQGWNGGAMVWEYPGAAAAWIQTVRASSWPV